jgi:hypothetical protein
MQLRCSLLARAAAMVDELIAARKRQPDSKQSRTKQLQHRIIKKAETLALLFAARFHRSILFHSHAASNAVGE